MVLRAEHPEPVEDLKIGPFYGAAGKLFSCTHPEVLLAGPSGTGKTMAVLTYATVKLLQYPGARAVFCRQTKASLAQSILKTFELHVLPMFERTGLMRALLGRAIRRENRTNYLFPNGSEVFLLGLENVDRTFSMEADLVCIFEVKEVGFETYQLLARCLRNNVLPVQQRICDTNPGHEFLWMSPRMGYFPQGRRNLKEPGRRIHLLSRHTDNPSITEAYIEELRSLPHGAVRDRMYLGRWVSEEGMILDMWDPAVHCIDKADVPEIAWYFGSMDFGYANPGCFAVWGVDKDDRMFEVAEVYRAGWQLDQWAEAIAELRREFPFWRVVADSAEPRSIDFLNDFLGTPGGREEERIVTPSDKSKGVLHGLNQVRWALTSDRGGRPRMFVVRDNVRCGRDEALARRAQPTCSVEEVGGYVFKKRQDGRPDKEEPDPACPDHGMDAWRYAAVWKWRKDLTPQAKAKEYAHGTWGDVLGHKAKLTRARKVGA